jgi:hypothetical protein
MARSVDYEAVAAGRPAGLRTGALVRVKAEFNTSARYTRPGVVYVVIADKFELCNLMELGGGMVTVKTGRFEWNAYARVPSTWLEIVDPAPALKALDAEVADR